MSENTIKNSQLFGIKKLENFEPSGLCRLEMDSITQQEICNIFDESISRLQKLEPIPYEIGYKPETFEIFKMQYDLPLSIRNSLKNPLNIEEYAPLKKKQKSSKQSNDIEKDIKAIYCGQTTSDDCIIGFQEIDKNHFLSNQLKVYHNGKTFTIDDRAGFIIRHEVSCFYLDGYLYFTSYSKAKKVLGLKDKFILASTEDVNNFKAHPYLSIENKMAFDNNCNDWVRRRIADIQRLGIFEKFTTEQIKIHSQQTNVNCIELKDGKIIIPDDKNELKVVLSFLVDESYHGPLTDTTYMTNSKRKV